MKKLVERRRGGGKLLLFIVATLISLPIAVIIPMIRDHPPALGFIVVIPYAIALTQVIFPTLLGWLLLFVPLVIITLFPVLILFADLISPTSPGASDPISEFLLILFLVVFPLSLLCIALYRDRPGAIIDAK